MEERPWAEWKQGRPLTPQSISRLLRPFEIRPRNTKMGGHVLKAYYKVDVSGAHARYVAALPSAQPLPRYRVENIEEDVAGEVAGSGITGSGSGSGSASEIAKGPQNQSGSGVAASSGVMEEGKEAISDREGEF